MTLSDIQSEMVRSMKSGDKVRVDTLRFLMAAIKNFAIAKYGNAWETSLNPSDVEDVIKKQVKTHKESVASFTNANRPELAAKEQQELDILASYLPKEVSDDELKALLSDVVTGDTSNFGLLMKSAMQKVAGKADGQRVSTILKDMLKN